MPRRLRPAALLALAALLGALALVACGGADDHGSASSDDAQALLRDTFGASHPIRSGRIDATLDVDLHGVASVPTPLALHLTGPFQSNGGTKLPDFALELDLDNASQTGGDLALGAVVAQGGAYVTVGGQAFDLGKDVAAGLRRSWQQTRADTGSSGSGTASLATLGIRPLDWLKDPQAKGTEDVGGTSTDHVAAAVDVPKLLADVSVLLGKAKDVTRAGGAAAGASVPTQLTAQQRQAIEREVTSASLDVWTGREDHTVRRIALDVRLASGHIGLQVSLTQLNERQTIRRPADARPVADLHQMLGALASSTTPGSTTTPGDPQAGYARCLADAGEDLAKVQRCARLLK